MNISVKWSTLQRETGIPKYILKEYSRHIKKNFGENSLSSYLGFLMYCRKMDILDVNKIIREFYKNKKSFDHINRLGSNKKIMANYKKFIIEENENGTK